MILRQSVIDNWIGWNRPLEGRIAWMYADTRQLVTTGVGNLIDPISLALDLPWQNENGDPASEMEIRNDWSAVKNDTALAEMGATAAASVARLHLTDDAIDALIMSKLDQFSEALTDTLDFADLPNWPAACQFAICSMAWGMGPYFAAAGRWPRFRAAVASGAWDAASADCSMNGSPPPVRRNALNAALFTASLTCGPDELPDALKPS